MIATDHPLRHPFQTIVSLGQLYGDVLYYATSMFDHFIANVSYCRPEPYYFWCYYFFMNIFWIIIPFCTCDPSLSVFKADGKPGLIVSSVRTAGRAFTALARMDKALQANGTVKKQN